MCVCEISIFENFHSSDTKVIKENLGTPLNDWLMDRLIDFNDISILQGYFMPRFFEPYLIRMANMSFTINRSRELSTDKEIVLFLVQYFLLNAHLNTKF